MLILNSSKKTGVLDPDSGKAQIASKYLFKELKSNNYVNIQPLFLFWQTQVNKHWLAIFGFYPGLLSKI